MNELQFNWERNTWQARQTGFITWIDVATDLARGYYDDGAKIL